MCIDKRTKKCMLLDLIFQKRRAYIKRVEWEMKLKLEIPSITADDARNFLSSGSNVIIDSINIYEDKVTSALKSHLYTLKNNHMPRKARFKPYSGISSELTPYDLVSVFVSASILTQESTQTQQPSSQGGSRKSVMMAPFKKHAIAKDRWLTNTNKLEFLSVEQALTGKKSAKLKLNGSLAAVSVAVSSEFGHSSGRISRGNPSR